MCPLDLEMGTDEHVAGAVTEHVGEMMNSEGL